MANATRDENNTPTILGVSSSDNTTPTPVKVNPITGRMLIELEGGSVGDMQASTYDPAGIEEQLVGIDAVQTVSNKTLVNTNYITMNTTPTSVPTTEGTLSWNDTERTLDMQVSSDVILQIGEEGILRVRNTTGSTITNGQVVYINGAVGNRPTVALAQANTQIEFVLGMATEDIANNSDGFITTRGLIRDVNTSGFSSGDTLYLSPTVAGGLTTTKPTYPNFPIIIGNVGISNPSNGTVTLGISNLTHFYGLEDTPSSYSSQQFKLLRVNETEDGIDFSPVTIDVTGGLSGGIIDLSLNALMGTKSQFSDSVTDGTFLYVGDNISSLNNDSGYSKLSGGNTFSGTQEIQGIKHYSQTVNIDGVGHSEAIVDSTGTTITTATINRTFHIKAYQTLGTNALGFNSEYEVQIKSDGTITINTIFYLGNAESLVVFNDSGTLKAKLNSTAVTTYNIVLVIDEIPQDGFFWYKGLTTYGSGFNIGIGTNTPGNLLVLEKSSFPIFDIIGGAHILRSGVETTTNRVFIGSSTNTPVDFLANDNVVATILANGNIGIGTNTPSSKLQIDSTTSGFLPPRMTTTQKNAISSPATGLVVYDTTLNKLCVYTGSAWETITSS